MKRRIQLLDCTLRDGAYVVDAKFGIATIKGIINKLQNANVDIIECGWLKNSEHVLGTSFYHVPNDLKNYISEKKKNITYTVMIDWDRYDLKFLPDCNKESVDAIRVVFPYEKYKEGIIVGEQIQKKGYKVFFQMANTLRYTDDDLVEFVKCVNKCSPEGVSVVDTFGAMYEEDLARIVRVLDAHLDMNIKLGFHSHNNQQLSFALTISFTEMLKASRRGILIDSSLCGMGRGAGNATTELVANYLNRKQFCNYDMNEIMDAIDIYMQQFSEKYVWGYSTPYFIAGMYCCHVNNIAYLLTNHRTSSKDMKNIIASMSIEERQKYDYDLLEKKYIDNQKYIINDEAVINKLKYLFKNQTILLVAPGKTAISEQEKIIEYAKQKNAIVLGVNAAISGYGYDYLFFANSARYEYAKVTYTETFENVNRILLSNIDVDDNDEVLENENIKNYYVNFNRVIKRGWEHFDNATISCLRLMDLLEVQDIAIAGFDGFKNKYNESYADESLPSLNPNNKWDELNAEIKDMYMDFLKCANYCRNIEFITESIYDL